MAQEEIKVAVVTETGNSDKNIEKVTDAAESNRRTIRALRADISKYRDDLLNLEKGSQEYTDTVNKLREAEEEVRTVNNAVRDSTKEVTEVREENTKTTEKNTSATRELRNRIKELTDVMIENGRGTKQYDEALSERIELQTRLNQSNEDLRAGTMNLTDVYGSVTNVAKGVVGGFSSLLSVTALLGGENTKLAETLVKLQAAMTLISSLTALSGSFKSLRNLVVLANTSFQAFNATLLANPLVIVGVAVVAFTGYLLAMTKAKKEDVEATEEQIETNVAYLDTLRDEETEISRNLQLQQAAGGTRIELINSEIEAYKDLIKQLELYWTQSQFTNSIEQNESLAAQRQAYLDRIEQLEFNSEVERTRIAAQEQNRREAQEKQAQSRLLAEKEQFESLRRSIESNSIERSIEEQREYVTRLEDDSRDITLSYAERTKALQNYTQALAVLTQMEKAELEAETQRLNETLRILDLQKEQEQIGRDLQIQRETDFQANYDLRQADLLLQEQENDAALIRIQDRLNTEELTNEKRIELIEEYNNRLIKSGQIQKQQADLTKQLEKQKLKAQQDLFKASAELLSASSQLLGEQTAAGKALSLASATVSTYAGASQVLANPTELNPYVKWAQFAATIATGLVAVKNIVAVDIPGASSSGASTATPSLPSFPEQLQPIQETHNNLTAYDEEILNQDRRVYVTEQDISRVQNRVDVVEDIATF